MVNNIKVRRCIGDSKQKYHMQSPHFSIEQDCMSLTWNVFVFEMTKLIWIFADLKLFPRQGNILISRPFYVCSKPCSTSTAPNVPVVGGTFRWNSGVRGSPNWFFSLKARRRPQHVPRIPIPEGSTSSKNFWGQVVQNSKNGFRDSATLWFGRFSGEIDSPPRSKSLPQYHSLVTSWNVVYFELQTLTKIYRGWLSDMATIKTELEVDQACKNEMLSETYGQKTEDQDTIIITKEFRSTSITTLFGSSDSFQTFNFCGKNIQAWNTLKIWDGEQKWWLGKGNSFQHMAIWCHMTFLGIHVQFQGWWTHPISRLKGVFAFCTSFWSELACNKSTVNMYVWPWNLTTPSWVDPTVNSTTSMCDDCVKWQNVSSHKLPYLSYLPSFLNGYPA